MAWGSVGEDREWANSTPSASKGGSGRGGAARSSAGRGAGPGRGGEHLIRSSHIHQPLFPRHVAQKY